MSSDQENNVELSQEQKDARWELMKQIAQLHNTGKQDDVMELLANNLDRLDHHVLSMVSNVIELTKEFVTKHHDLLTKIANLDHGKQDLRDGFRFALLNGLLEETNQVETP